MPAIALLLAAAGMVYLVGLPKLGTKLLRTGVGAAVLLSLAPAVLGTLLADPAAHDVFATGCLLLAAAGGLVLAAKLVSGEREKRTLPRPTIRTRAHLVEPEPAPGMPAPVAPAAREGDDLHLFEEHGPRSHN